MTPEQFNRLPRYAQQHIHKLEADLAYERKQLAESLGTSDAVSRIWLGSGLLDSRKRYLPAREQVTFRLGKDERDTAQVRLNQRHELEIHTSQPMVVLPHVTNMIKVVLHDD